MTKSIGLLLNRVIRSNETKWLEPKLNFDNRETKSKVFLIQNGFSRNGVSMSFNHTAQS